MAFDRSPAFELLTWLVKMVAVVFTSLSLCIPPRTGHPTTKNMNLVTINRIYSRHHHVTASSPPILLRMISKTNKQMLVAGMVVATFLVKPL